MSTLRKRTKKRKARVEDITILQAPFKFILALTKAAGSTNTAKGLSNRLDGAESSSLYMSTAVETTAKAVTTRRSVNNIQESLD